MCRSGALGASDRNEYTSRTMTRCCPCQSIAAALLVKLGVLTTMLLTLGRSPGPALHDARSRSRRARRSFRSNVRRFWPVATCSAAALAGLHSPSDAGLIISRDGAASRYTDRSGRRASARLLWWGLTGCRGRGSLGWRMSCVLKRSWKRFPGALRAGSATGAAAARQTRAGRQRLLLARRSSPQQRTSPSGE